MPELSRFFGIVISIFYNDHAPPHVHVRFGGKEASIEIRTGRKLTGELPKLALDLVRAWLVMHQEEVIEAWKTAQNGKAPEKISPLPGGHLRKRTQRDLSHAKAATTSKSDRSCPPYPALRLVEWLEGNLVRLFFSTGLIKEVRVPTKSAKKARIVFGGMGLDIDGKGYEMSAPRLAGMRGKTMRKANKR